MKDKLPLLKRILNYIDPSETRAVTAVYISPAQKLRNMEDEIEQRQTDFYELAELIKKIEEE
mgnify:CR=1 FL=1